MKYATIRLVFDRKHQATKETKGLVQIEVLYHGKRKWISTGVKLYAGEWNEKTHVINRPTALEENILLTAQVTQIQEFISSLIKRNEPFSFEALEAFLNKTKTKRSLIEFIAEHIEKRNDVCENTRKKHRTLLYALEEFGHIINMEDVTKANITLFDDFLHNRKYKQTTIWNYHKRLKAYINIAIKYELLNSNPYNFLKFAHGKSEGIKYLTKEEMDILEHAKTNNRHIEQARDVFIFQCYTGLSYSDLAKFKWEDVVEQDGNYIIKDVRTKTEEEYYIVLLKPALRVLKRYDYNLPVVSNQKYNEYLKVAALSAGIDKPITSHWARHSYAVMALSLGAKMQNVARMLGHASTKITESVYAKVLAKDLQKDFELINSQLL